MPTIPQIHKLEQEPCSHLYQGQQEIFPKVLHPRSELVHCYRCKGVIVKILIETHKIQDQRSYHWWTESKCCASTSIQCWTWTIPFLLYLNMETKHMCTFFYLLYQTWMFMHIFVWIYVEEQIVSVDCYISPNIQKKLGKEVKCTVHWGGIV